VKYPLLAILFVSSVFLGGCQNKEKTGDEFVSESLKELVSPSPAPTSGASRRTSIPKRQTIHPVHAPKTPPIGIVVDQNRIIIDTNQTRRFLESLTRKLDRNFKQIEQGLRKEKLQSPNETGIIITKDRIEVDLNQTQNFVNKWIRSMEAVGKQLDGIAKELDKSLNP